jgi:hypothetical protein
VPGSVPYAIALFIGLYRWLEPERRATQRPALTT